MLSTIIISNTTPHEILLFVGNNDVKRFKPENGLRLIAEPQQQVVDSIFNINDIPVVTKQNFIGFKWDDPAKVPCKNNMVLLVSMPVGEYFAAHPELAEYTIMGPDTGPDGVIRDNAGKIIGTKRFILYAKQAE